MPLSRKFSKVKSFFCTKRRIEEEKKESSSNLGNKSSSVNHEYMEAFRTKSYVEIYDKVQGQLAGRNKEIVAGDVSLPSTSSYLPRHASLSGCLLQLCQETLAELPQQAIHAHPLLNEYFLVTLEACKICESLLKNVLQTRINYKNIKTAIKRSFPQAQSSVWSEDQLSSIYNEFSSFSMLRNPLSSITQVHFNEVQNKHFELLHQMVSRRRKVKRKIKFLRFCKKALGSTLVVGCTAFAIAFTVVAIHCMVCFMAAPALIAFSFAASKRLRGTKTTRLQRLYAQLDAAAKGVYILINDFDTMSRLVGRLHDEMEHNKAIADLCARKHNDDMLKEVVRDFAIHEGWFLEQLNELEQHIYLCFLNIIRSRRMVVEEIKIT